MTYLEHQKRGTSDVWKERIANRNALWATPGPYLRHSMLNELLRQANIGEAEQKRLVSIGSFTTTKVEADPAAAALDLARQETKSIMEIRKVSDSIGNKRRKGTHQTGANTYTSEEDDEDSSESDDE